MGTSSKSRSIPHKWLGQELAKNADDGPDSEQRDDLKNLAPFAPKWAILDCSLVEAGGIEPPSEDPPEMATTRLVRNFELAERSPTNGLSRSQPIVVSGHRPIGKLRHPSPLNDASTRGHGRTAARR